MDFQSSDSLEPANKPRFLSVHALNKLHLIDLQQMPHSSSVWVGLKETVSLLLLLSTLWVGPLPPNPKLSVAHCEIFRFVGDLKPASAFSENTRKLFIVLCFCLFAFKLCLTASAMHLSRQIHDFSSSKEKDLLVVVLKVHALLSFFGQAVFITPICSMLISGLFYGSVAYWLLSVGSLTLLVVDSRVHSLLTFDYRFVRENRLQGRSYLDFNVALAGSAAIALVHEIMREFGYERGLRVLNFVHVCFAAGLLLLKAWCEAQFWFAGLRAFLYFKALVHLWIAIAAVVHASSPQLLQSVDFDLIGACAVCLGLLALHSALQAKNRSLLTSQKSSLEKDPQVASLYLESLSKELREIETGRIASTGSVYAFGLVQSHTSECSSPYCLCFLLRTNYLQQIGQKPSETIKSLLQAEEAASQLTGDGHLAFFDDPSLISSMRRRHETMVRPTEVVSGKTIQFEKSEITEEIRSSCSVSLGSAEKNRLFMVSQYHHYLTRSQAKFHSQLVLGCLRYLAFEYNNLVAALVLGYRYLEDRQLKLARSDSAWLLVQNLIHLARSGQSRSESFGAQSSLSGVDVGTALEFRSRVDGLQASIREQLCEKLQLYSQLSQQQIELAALVRVSDGLYGKQAAAEQEMRRLLAFKRDSVELLRLVGLYETVVKEQVRSSVSLALKRAGSSARDWGRGRPGSSSGLGRLPRASVFDSRLAVVFVARRRGCFRVVRCTSNAGDFFGLGEAELQLARLADFMPGAVAGCHDAIVAKFLNGQSQRQASGPLSVALLGADQVCRSVSVAVKLDCRFLEEVAVAGLLALRLPEDRPVLFADAAGTLLGSNRSAKAFLGQAAPVDRGALFCLLPGLWPVFAKRLAQAASRQPEAGPKAASRSRDSTLQDLSLYCFAMNAQTRFRGASLGQDPHSRPSFTSKLQTELLTHLREESSHILRETDKLFTARATLRLNLYQQGLALVEVCLDELDKASAAETGFLAAALGQDRKAGHEVFLMSPKAVRAVLRMGGLIDSFDASGLLDREEDPSALPEEIPGPARLSSQLSADRDRPEDTPEADAGPQEAGSPTAGPQQAGSRSTVQHRTQQAR